MKRLRHVLLVAVLWGVILAPSMVFATIYTDWWGGDASQSGHGFNLNQQGNVLTLAWYNYDQTGADMWLLMAATLTGNTATGVVQRYTGPAFGTPFDPAQVVATPVGTGTITFPDPNHATFSYTIYGIPGSVALTRVTYAPLPIAGQYLGGEIGVSSGCVFPSNNGSYIVGAAFALATSGNSITVQVFRIDGAVCTASGQYTQNGSKISAQGSFACTGGGGGSWSSNDISVLENAFVAKATLQYTVGETCHIEATFGGLRQ